MKKLWISLLLVPLLFCGCQGNPDIETPDPGALTVPEEGLLCCIRDSTTEEELILTGEQVPVYMK